MIIWENKNKNKIDKKKSKIKYRGPEYTMI